MTAHRRPSLGLPFIPRHRLCPVRLALRRCVASCRTASTREESVIGGLFSGRAMTLVADIINSDDFLRRQARSHGAAIVDLDQRSKPIDLITVAEQMRQSGTMASCWHSAAKRGLAEPLNKIGTVENIAPRAHHSGKGTARRLILTCVVDPRARLFRRDRCRWLSDQAQQAVFEDRQPIEPSELRASPSRAP